ncbi:MAG: ABC transporter permease [Actinomycetales bacterium]|nr:ABC transporter permease [Actinomycetales bacterium]
MIVYIVRRLVVSFFILLGATALVFWLVAISGDPLEDLYADQSPNKEDKIAERTRRMHLDQPIPQRYLTWLAGVAKCVVPGQGCDLGTNQTGQDVKVLLGNAAGATLRLVLVAVVVAIVIGVTVGIVSALRQYSGFDYTITFAAFLFFSLPVFWVAVLLKQYLAIEFNDWLADPRIGPVPMIALGLLSGLTWSAVIGGERRRRLTVFGVACAVTVLLLLYLLAVDWFTYPALGPGLVTVFALGTAVGVTELVSGLHRRGVLHASLAAAGVGIIAQFVLAGVLEDPSWPVVLLLAASTVPIGIGLGMVFGQLDKPQAARAAVLTGLLTGTLVFTDRALSAVHGYSQRVNGRIVATIGSDTPNFTGDFWQRFIDTVTHLALPTLAIMLISFATYARFTRATMLEVMSQDYVRTARAKGLTERTVVMRHAFRNALIPVTTLMAIDFGGVIGGAVITENVFGWEGMGTLFINGLERSDPNPVMGFFVLTATSIVIFNMLADIAYAYLDPRIRMS